MYEFIDKNGNISANAAKVIYIYIQFKHLLNVNKYNNR